MNFGNCILHTEHRSTRLAEAIKIMHDAPSCTRDTKCRLKLYYFRQLYFLTFSLQFPGIFWVWFCCLRIGCSRVCSSNAANRFPTDSWCMGWPTSGL